MTHLFLVSHLFFYIFAKKQKWDTVQYLSLVMDLI